MVGIADRERFDIGDGQREAGTLEQGAGIAHVGEGDDPRACAARHLRSRRRAGSRAVRRACRRRPWRRGKAHRASAPGGSGSACPECRSRPAATAATRQGRCSAGRAGRARAPPRCRLRRRGKRRRPRCGSTSSALPDARTAALAPPVSRRTAPRPSQNAARPRRAARRDLRPRARIRKSAPGDGARQRPALARRSEGPCRRSAARGSFPTVSGCGGKASPRRLRYLLSSAGLDRKRRTGATMPHSGALPSHALALPARSLFPPVCAGCRRQVSQPGALCGDVLAEASLPRKALVRGDGHAVLGTTWARDFFPPRRSPIRRPSSGRGRRSPIPGVARQMVQGLKYNDRTDLAPWMARWMLRAGAELSPTPMSSCRCRCTGGASFPPLQPVGGTGARRSLRCRASRLRRWRSGA